MKEEGTIGVVMPAGLVAQASACGHLQQAPGTADRPPPRVCVLLPTFNNSLTVARVIREVQARVGDVLVVNDGSTDATADVLRRFPSVTVMTHEANAGKGAALATGLARAKAMGFTHAISMDTDGQHVASDLPALLSAVAANPDAIVIGVRDLRGPKRDDRGGAARPEPGRTGARKSRLLRAHSNFWVWVETGRWIRDTQSGFRAYPLEATQALALTGRKYDFEIECLVKALWSGVPVVETPVRVEYGPGSRSHFRPFRDFLRVSRLNAWLTAQRFLLPKPLRRVVHLKSFREGPRLGGRVRRLLRDALLEQCGAPGVFGASVGLGVFFGIAPIWGFQMAAAVAAAHALRLRKAIALVASNISFPAAIPFILYASLLLGRLALGGRVDPTLRVADLNLGMIGGYLAEYVAGSLILATVMGLAAGAAAWLLARLAGRAAA